MSCAPLLQLPHNRKTLLKILLRIITISSYQPTGNLSATRPVDDDAQLLYASLKVRLMIEACLLSWSYQATLHLCQGAGLVHPWPCQMM